MAQTSRIKISSNKSFGIVFSVVFLILGLWPLISGNAILIWAILISIVFLILGVMNSKLLSPLNKIWFKFGLVLGSLIAPIFVGIVFFLVVTPIGLFMRVLGKDLLNMKFNKKIKTYWIKRDILIGTMKRQF
jgi:hypothetical protein